MNRLSKIMGVRMAKKNAPKRELREDRESSEFDEKEPQGVRPRELRRLIGYVVRHRGPFWGGMGLILVATAAALLEPRLLGMAIDDAIIPGDIQELRTIAAVFLLVECVRVSSTIAQGYCFARLGQAVMQDLRLAVFSHLQRLPVSVHDKNPAGRLVTRVTNDISALAEMFSAGFVSIIANGLTVLGISVWLFALDLKLAAVALGVFPFLIWTSIYFSARLRIAYRDARSKLSALNAFLAENIAGMRVVHLFNRERVHLKRFSRVNHSYTEAQEGSIRIFAVFQPTITLATGVAMAGVVWYGGGRAATGTLQLGVLVAFFSYVLSLFQPIREIADKWNLFLSGMASAERIFSVLDWPTETREDEIREPAEPIAGLKGKIVFENVWFAYSGEDWVLKNFSLVVEPGQRIGVVGHTGAGKTTLMSLLMRYYEPQKGRILLDGKDLRDYGRRSLRASIGMIQQDVFLFSGTIEENIRLWKTDGAGASAKASRDFPEFPILQKLLENPKELHERGVNLSTGERQMIAFARALEVDPAIWILDEATANVDSDSERQLERALATFSSGRTALLIAHRLATVQSADQILVLHRGELVERGKHGELMNLGGIYARMYDLQESGVVE